MTLTVELMRELKDVTYFRVSAGKDGGQPVTVRVGIHNRYACLTCNVITCQHAETARDWDAERLGAAS